MLWFRYKWELTRSRGLCVKIIRGGADIQSTELELRQLWNMPMSAGVGRAIINNLSDMIKGIEGMIFSADALLYREEKDLIRFCRRVESATERLTARLLRAKRRYMRDAQRLSNRLRESQMKKRKLPISLGKIVQQEQQSIAKDEQRKKELLGLLSKLTSFIRVLDKKIDDTYLDAKAQNRSTLNLYLIKEEVTIRSNIRLGKLSRRKAIKAGSSIKEIRKRLRRFGAIVSAGERLDPRRVDNLLEYCRMEASDLNTIFLFVIQVSRRIGGRLNSIGKIIFSNPRLKPLNEEYAKARERLNQLRRDIDTQQKRLHNEFKNKGFVPHPIIQREMKAAA